MWKEGRNKELSVKTGTSLETITWFVGRGFSRDLQGPQNTGLQPLTIGSIQAR